MADESWLVLTDEFAAMFGLRDPGVRDPGADLSAVSDIRLVICPPARDPVLAHGGTLGDRLTKYVVVRFARTAC
jgi:hypothetical protein